VNTLSGCEKGGGEQLVVFSSGVVERCRWQTVEASGSGKGLAVFWLFSSASKQANNNPRYHLHK
jgi:hypothetical protein